MKDAGAERVKGVVELTCKVLSSIGLGFDVGDWKEVAEFCQSFLSLLEILFACKNSTVGSGREEKN